MEAAVAIQEPVDLAEAAAEEREVAVELRSVFQAVAAVAADLTAVPEEM
jgi:hypothetical protein